MKLGVLSDTHDRLPAFRRAVAFFLEQRVDAILHAGDYVAPFAAKLLNPDAVGNTPVHAIYGNNDGERDGLKKTLPQITDGPVRLELGGRSVAMAHFVDWFPLESHERADILISGHDHEARVQTKPVAGRERLYLNPGECCGWLTGRCTVALLETDTLHAELVEIHD